MFTFLDKLAINTAIRLVIFDYFLKPLLIIFGSVWFLGVFTLLYLALSVFPNVKNYVSLPKAVVVQQYEYNNYFKNQLCRVVKIDNRFVEVTPLDTHPSHDYKKCDVDSMIKINQYKVVKKEFKSKLNFFSLFTDQFIVLFFGMLLIYPMLYICLNKVYKITLLNTVIMNIMYIMVFVTVCISSWYDSYSVYPDNDIIHVTDVYLDKDGKIYNGYNKYPILSLSKPQNFTNTGVIK